ncbi:MAG: VWA domain-containing protein [Deltaproteobacteria bacterium]|nr:MAG: VWA domain-containing protein [Deltaproteobacteria bacterium]
MNVWMVVRTVGHVLFGIGGLALLLMCSGLLSAPTWGLPVALLLLVPVLLLPAQAALTGVNRLAVARVAGQRQGFSYRLPLAFLPGALLLIGMGAMVLALAQPREVERRLDRSAEGLDILLAVDTSCSMEARDLQAMGQPVSRLEVAKGVMADFIKGRPNDRIGVVVFGEEAFTHVPLTLDHKTLLDVLEQVEIGVAGARGTAIGTAIAVSARRLMQIDNPERVLILLTDGENNAGRLTPLEAADAAAAIGVRIYTVGVTGGGRRMGLGRLMMGGRDEIDEHMMKAVAEKTGGAFFRATSAEALARVYRTIDELERSPAEVYEDVEEHDWYRYALLPGLAALLLQLIVSTFLLRRWP